MPRTIKTIKLEDGSDLEVYADNCNMCQMEMIFPKDEADKLEKQFPFLKQKIEAGTPCVECIKNLKQEEIHELFSLEDIEEIKNLIPKGK